MKAAKSMLGKMIIALIKGYQLCISPFLMPGKCRFTPVCSVYFIQAVEKYGPFKGSWLGFKRIMNCHPFHNGGYDPLK